MNNQRTIDNQSAPDDNIKISPQSSALLDHLACRGIIADAKIDDERIQQALKERNRNMYHNTLLLLQNYRNIVWALECFPETVAAELDQSLKDLDALLDRVDAEIGMENRKLESRLESVRRSRLMLDRVNEALSVLKRKPDNGQRLYDIIYLTFLSPNKLSHSDLLYQLDMSSRNYYRLRQQAITILSIRLWSAPAAEIDSWMEVLSILENFR